MKFGGFKIGKSKEKNNPEEEANAEIIGEILADSDEDGIPIKPHAPLQELSLEDAEALEAPDVITAEEAAEESDEGVKLVEVQVDPTVSAAPIPEVTTKEEDKLDLNTSISNIFNNIEDDENPLANLIKALPDVAATELIDDLKEINDIIKDWQKK